MDVGFSHDELVRPNELVPANRHGHRHDDNNNDDAAAADDLERSDRHDSGFALRFPRILRIRDDKPVSEIDTVARVEEIYQSQVDKPAESGDDSVDSAN